MDHTFDVIVIGSGVGGLTAALTAARKGQTVLVLEAGKAIGGYLNPFRRGPYEFNPGLHYLGECGPGQQFTHLLDRLGLSEDIQFRELSPHGFDRLVLPGYEVSMPKGHEQYRDRLTTDFPDQHQGLAKFFRTLHEFGQTVTQLIQPAGTRAAIRNIRQSPLFFKYGRMTFGQLLDGHFTDPLLKAVLAAQAGNYGLPPQRASALVGLATLHHYLGGAYFPIGGSRAIRDAFVRHIERHGGVLKTQHAVEKIIIRDGHAHGVRCRNGEEYFADCIISNADAAITYRDLVGLELLPARLRERVEQTRWSFGSICLFIGTDLDLAAAGMTDANIWSVPTIDGHDTLASMMNGSLAKDDYYFLSSASMKDPPPEGAEPRKHYTLDCVMLAPFEPFARWADKKTMKRGADYEALKEQLADRYLNCVERHVPGIRDHLRVLEVGTPATNLTYTAAPQGAIYGPEHTPSPTGQPRYSLEGALPGLFFCGSSTLGACIVFASISGFMAAEIAFSTMRH